MNHQIRPELPTDLAGIRRLNVAAFPTAAEADLVDTLRSNGKATLSLVAIQDDRVVGHILFSPVTITSHDGQRPGLGLAPMAVHPDSQRTGIGSALVDAGLAQCRLSAASYIVVLGHPAYYPRFGFTPASLFGIKCEYDVPDEAFMVVELAEGALNNTSGLARYQPEFSEV